MRLNKKYYYLIAALFLIVGVLFVVWKYFGATEINFSPIPENEQTFRPRRPGTSGIVLQGPPIRDCVFSINEQAAGLRSIIWSELTAIDQTADVVISATIRTDGTLAINRIQDRGHPAASRYITERMATWVFTTCKHGEIHFWYNAGANRIVIDARQCVVSTTSGGQVIDGKLHLVDAPKGIVRLGGFPK